MLESEQAANGDEETSWQRPAMTWSNLILYRVQAALPQEEKEEEDG